MIKDMTGKRFGRLTVKEFAGMNYRHSATWLCVCDCGNLKTVDGNSLRMGGVRSCGCLDKEAHITRPNRRTHGMNGTRINRIWRAMKARCANRNDKLYGGRGISVCAEWSDFEPFYEWAIANGYTDDLTIDRIDPDGDYCPSNCRWITIKEQQSNRRTNNNITINGETHTITQWASISGLHYSTLWKRMKKGISGEDLIKKGG